MKTSFIFGFTFLFLAGLGSVFSAQAQTKSEAKVATEVPSGKFWGLKVEKSVNDLHIPAVVVGDGWNEMPVFRAPDLHDIESLDPKLQKAAATLAEQYKSQGVRSVANFSFLKPSVRVGSISIRLLIFDDAAKCKAWWEKKYQYEGWEKDFKKVELKNSHCVENLKHASQVMAFGNIGITGQQHSIRDKTKYITAMRSLSLELLDGAKVTQEDRAVKSKPSSKVDEKDLVKDAAENMDENKAKTAKKDHSGGWHVFRGDALSSGVAKEALPDDLEVLWEYKVPKGAFDGTANITQAVDSDEQTVYIGDLDGMLFAFDLKTGEKKWEYKTPISFSSSAAYRDGRIFIGDIDGIFYCVSTEGKLLWKYETGGEISSSANFYKGNVLVGSQDSNLYLLNAETGELIWKHQTPDQIRCSATVAGDNAFVAGCDGFLHVVNLQDGTELGSVDIKSPTGSTQAAHGYSVSFDTEQAEFRAVNWKTVKGTWAFSDDKGQAAVRGCAAVNKDHVVFGARNRQVYSLNPVTGDQNWTVTLKAKVDSSPIIAGDKVYVGSTDGRFYVLSLKDGSTIWEKQFNGAFLSSPAAAFGKLVIATDRGVVYCLGKK